MPQSNQHAFEWDVVGKDRESLRRSLANRLIYSLGKDPITATRRDWYHATAYAMRDRLIEHWMDTLRRYHFRGAKRVYYLSLEFLTGRLLISHMMSMGLLDACREAVSDFGMSLDDLIEQEPDAALGNGGLGRLAACLLDSMATQSLPGYGYGIRYEYGLFYQRIERGVQVEQPDSWLRYGNPWEIARPEVLFPVTFGGRVVQSVDEGGRERFRWVDTDLVMAMAFDTPIPGYGGATVNNMRLWSAKASREFNLQDFNEGNYIKSVEQKTESENLSKVLYPSDSTLRGRELRLKQQYFFVSASLQDMLRRFFDDHSNIDELPDRVAIQMNDTHPSLAIPELMRLLLDVYDLDWDRAWDLTRRTVAYTNHTLMPEALETWPVSLFERTLPRHLQIIYEVNHRFLAAVREAAPGDPERVRRMSIVDEAGERRLRMAHLAIIGSHAVNGVSAIHTDLMKRTIFADFERFAPGTIINITNGITPRRWLQQANPGLAALVTERIGAGWTADLSELQRLAPLAEEPDLQRQFLEVKLANKARLATLVWERLQLKIDPSSMFDVQVKRLHEYKRQLLNILYVLTRYQRILEARDGPIARTVIFSGKAAPGYAVAKLVVELIHRVADLINGDPAVGGRLRVVFVPNYSVSNAEIIIPAADLSEQISTAGTEASGTGNMKLALNGALTIGTLDGATIEMRAEIGGDNMFIFGLTADEVVARRASGYNPWEIVASNPELRQALDMLASVRLSPGAPDRFRPIVDALTTYGDQFLVLADFASYSECQDRVDQLFGRPQEWARRAILNVAAMGNFSSDRTVLDYARKVWNVQPCEASRPNQSASVSAASSI